MYPCFEPRASRWPRRVHGGVTVELAVCLTVFVVLVFGTLEAARFLYVVNTVQDITREAARGASITDFTNGPEMAALRRRALFRDTDGALALVPNLTPAQVRVEYLSMQEDGTVSVVTPLPACPAANLRECTANPNAATCIRAVRVSICREANGACEALPYEPLTGVVPALNSLQVPLSSTVVKAESLGYRPGVNNCL